MSRDKYVVKRADRANGGATTIQVGDVVYLAAVHDYGLANDDTRYFGIEHVSVTRDEDGGYPTFTIPKMDLEKQA